MELPKLTETLIINGVVIANGVADSDGDILNKAEIKTINMKYQRDTDTMHTNIKNDGVEVFNTWISEVDTTIKGKVAPAGSWMVTMKVTNPQLIQCIEQGKINGFSLGSVSEKAMTPKYWFINKSLNYRDIKNIEEVIPLFISFVDKPANQYGFEVMTYDAYINKNEKDVKEMTESKKEDMIPVSFVEKLMDKLSINKSEDNVTVEKAEEEPVVEETTEATADETVTALFEKLDTIIEQNNQILAGLQKSEEEEKDDEEIEKAEEEESEEKEKEASSEEEKDDEEIEKAEETETAEEEEKKEDEVTVEKRETSMIENQNTQSHTTFYQKTGRDSLGRKIRQ